MNNINWYPGHMKKTRELISENIKMSDVVLEITDARIPKSGRNPIIDEIIGNKRRIIILTKSDLADEVETAKWQAKFKSEGKESMTVNGNTGSGTKNLIKRLNEIKNEEDKKRNLKRSLRIMVVGVPNAGKSSVINRLSGKKSTRIGNKPGITRGKQWVHIGENIDLLDTPGILWPKFEDPKSGLNLAFVGSIKDEILDIEDIAIELLKLLSLKYENLILNRYNLDSIGRSPLETMEKICKKRGFIKKGENFDYERASKTIIDEFRSGKIGNITIDTIGD